MIESASPCHHCTGTATSASRNPQSRPNNRASSSNAWNRPLATWTMSSMNIASMSGFANTCLSPSGIADDNPL